MNKQTNKRINKMLRRNNLRGGRISRVASNSAMQDQLVDFLETNFEKIRLKQSQIMTMKSEFESALHNHSLDVERFANSLDGAIKLPSWDEDVRESLLNLKSYLKTAVPHLENSYGNIASDRNIMKSFESISNAGGEVRKITKF